MKSRWKILLFILILAGAVNAYAWSIHQVLEWREPDFPVECVSYSDFPETRAGLLERGFDSDMLADMSSGRRPDGSSYGYFRIDPPNIPEIWLCYYEWGADAGERSDGFSHFFGVSPSEHRGSLWDIDLWEYDLDLESYTEGICIWESPPGRHKTRTRGTKCPPRP